MIKVSPISTKEALDKAFIIRQKVFVDEQKVPAELEYDEFEEKSKHYLAEVGGQPAGTARWRYTEKGVKLERFAVLPGFRGTHVGEALVREVLNDLISEDKPIYLNAQVQVIPFYEKYGFEAMGELFEEAGIMHRVMYLKKS